MMNTIDVKRYAIEATFGQACSVECMTFAFPRETSSNHSADSPPCARQCPWPTKAQLFVGGDRPLRGLHAAETEVVASRADFSFASRTHHVAGAIGVGTQERPATMHPLAFARLGGIERGIRPSWI